MGFFKGIRAVFTGIILNFFPSLDPEGVISVINNQIIAYQRLKKKKPDVAEDDILNSLIMSRVNDDSLNPSAKPEASAHYETILKNKNKTVEDAIFAIVEYEYILSRRGQLLKDLAAVGAGPAEITEELERWRNYIRKSVKKHITTG